MKILRIYFYMDGRDEARAQNACPDSPSLPRKCGLRQKPRFCGFLFAVGVTVWGVCSTRTLLSIFPINREVDPERERSSEDQSLGFL